jgi:hypothetical protein
MVQGGATEIQARNAGDTSLGLHNTKTTNTTNSKEGIYKIGEKKETNKYVKQGDVNSAY